MGEDVTRTAATSNHAPPSSSHALAAAARSVLGASASADPRYRQVCTLARGGIAEVSVVVRQEGAFRRLYAQKRLLPHLRDNDAINAMFLDEARFAGLIRHTNVVSVLDVGRDAVGPYLLMNYIEGVTLAELIGRVDAVGEIVPLPIAIDLMLGVSRGLHAAHELTGIDGQALQLIHRDVSPQNLMVGFDGVAKVADFGIAKAIGQTTHTATGIIKGKLGYLSPEQLRFEEPDRRSDLFSFGVVFFELLAGRRLYRNKDGMDGVRRILREPVPDIGDERADVPDEIVALLFRLMAKEPALRPTSASEVTTILEEVKQDLASLPCDVADYLATLFESQRNERAQKIEQHLARLDRETLEKNDSAAADNSPKTTAIAEKSNSNNLKVGATSAVETTSFAPKSTGSTKRRTPWALATMFVLSAAMLGAALLGKTGFLAMPGARVSRLVTGLPAMNDSTVVTVTIQSDPAGAKVSHQGQLRGYTPLNILLFRKAGEQRIEISKEGFQTSVEAIEPSVDQRLRVRLLPTIASSAQSQPPARVRPATKMRPNTLATKTTKPLRPPPPRSKGIHRIGAKR